MPVHFFSAIDECGDGVAVGIHGRCDEETIGALAYHGALSISDAVEELLHVVASVGGHVPAKEDSETFQVRPFTQVEFDWYIDDLFNHLQVLAEVGWNPERIADRTAQRREARARHLHLVQ